MKAIGILPEQHLSYVDHLVPLCQLMQIPILVTDPWMKQLIELYYPPMEILLAEPHDFNLDPFLQGYEVFFYVDFFRKGNGTFHFRNYFTTHKVRAVMSLHGNPDKYWQIYWIEQLSDEDIVLAYGSQLLEFLKHRGVSKKPILCGNYRLEFYKMHEAFFDKTLPFKKEKKTLLYAPTWSAPSKKIELRINYSSFFEVYQRVFETLGPLYQLIVKLHPVVFKTMPGEIERVMQEHPEIYFLQDYPPIYPLLKHTDLYLGDYSSIGYDFLYFDRPLFFLETTEQTHLQECGQKITKEELPHLNEAHYDRKKMYTHAFGDIIPLDQLKKEIEDACRSSPR
jgi:hypothetical protein